MALPRVATVTVKFTAAPFVTDTFGALQVVSMGKPEHENASVPLKPAAGVACRLNCAVCPALTEALKVAPAAATIVTAIPDVPLIAPVCGEFASSSLLARVVVPVPHACG